MAKEMKKVDIVTIGGGFTAGVIAAECTRAGLTVVSLERGENKTLEDFAEIHDEWRYAVNYGIMQDCSKETVTFRNNREQEALPMRRMGSFLLGNGVGGAGNHWNGMLFRFFPYDFKIKTMTDERYGKNKLSSDYFLEDWPMTYEELEPYYDKFEKVVATSGEVGPYDGKRTSGYPLPPLVKSPEMAMVEKAAIKAGCKPYNSPAAIASEAYENPYGESIGQCMYCGFCERFACEFGAKGMPINTVMPAALRTGKYEIRTHSNVVEIMKKGSKVTGVKYINTLTMEEYIQPADIVVLTSFALNNAKLLMVSKIGDMYDPKTGRGTLGKNYCYQIGGGVTSFFDKQMHTFAGAGALGIAVDDYNADHFDHSKLGFIHGALISYLQTGQRPILSNPTPPGTPSWGPEFKKASTYYFTRTLGLSAQGASLPHKENYLSLDDTYKDAYGVPLLKMTYNFTDNDKALNRYIVSQMTEIAKNLGAKTIAPSAALNNYSIIPYQSTHNTGGTMMGKTPRDSVVNSYLQHWDAENLFVVGAGNFRHNSGRNPTATVGALSYRCAEGIIKYSKKSGSLV